MSYWSEHDVVKVDKGASCDPRFENKSVNTDNIFQVQQDFLEEARKEVFQVLGRTSFR